MVLAATALGVCLAGPQVHGRGFAPKSPNHPYRQLYPRTSVKLGEARMLAGQAAHARLGKHLLFSGPTVNRGQATWFVTRKERGPARLPGIRTVYRLLRARRMVTVDMRKAAGPDGRVTITRLPRRLFNLTPIQVGLGPGSRRTATGLPLIKEALRNDMAGASTRP